MNVNGTLNYDLAQVTPLLRPYLGDGIQLTGREQARFALAGKLADEGGPQMLSSRAYAIERSVSTRNADNCRSPATSLVAPRPCPARTALERRECLRPARRRRPTRRHVGRRRASRRTTVARRRRRSAHGRAERPIRSRAGRADDAGRAADHERAHLARSQRGDAEVRRPGARRRDAERRPVLAAARRRARAARRHEEGRRGRAS